MPEITPPDPRIELFKLFDPEGDRVDWGADDYDVEIGGMSDITAPSEHEEDGPERILREELTAVQRRCQDAILVAVEEELAGNDRSSSGVLLGSALRDMAVDAAQHGDLRTAEQYIDALVQIAPELQDAIARSAFAAARAGSEPAYRTLQGVLFSEAQRAVEKKKIDQLDDPYTAPVVDTPALRQVVMDCAQKDVPPDAWIEHAVGRDEQWELTVLYFNEAALRGGDEAENARQRLADTISVLTDPSVFDDKFVYAQANSMLGLTDDTGLQKRIVERFISASQDVRLHEGNFREFVAVGRTILDTPGLADERTLAYFEQAIKYGAERLQASGADAASIEPLLIPWNVAYTIYSGAQPQEVTEYINERVGQLYNQQDLSQGYGAHVSDAALSQEYIDDLRAHYLRDAAVRFAFSKNFEGAKACMAGLPANKDRSDALRQCLRYATKPAQIELMEPDELAVQVYPQLNQDLIFAKTRLTGDIYGIAELTESWARLSDEVSLEAIATYGEESFMFVAQEDPERAAAMAQYALAVLREAGASLDKAVPLSTLLVQSGDVEEASYAYHDIYNRTQSADRLARIVLLAKNIRIGLHHLTHN